MELDPQFLVISNKYYGAKFGKRVLRKTNVTLKKYSGEKIVPLGVTNVQVVSEGQYAQLCNGKW